ncbi:microtubule-associated protein futsch-like isoform X3 [Montipora capricornis]
MRKPRTSQYKEASPPAINALVLSNKKERETSLLFQASGEADWVIYQSTASRYGLAVEVPVMLLRLLEKWLRKTLNQRVLSCDGVIKIWDKDKTLLREIIMNETLTVASFLNDQGDILIGFKQHIFIIPNAKVYPMKDGLLSAFGDDNLDDDAFETESDIYEDPSVRFESKKILQPDPTNMDNYLVPFPNLQLKTSWFMEGRPPPDLEQQNQQEEKESISSMSDSLSFAPTEVYFSPSSTPRRLSMASSVALSEHQSRSKLWELPEFCDSPLSSPPRTPPPEPAMPSTPPLEEESDEELSEDEKAKDEPVQGSQPPCDQCTGALKQEGKRNVPFIPSFRRGRLGNISIDSKSLRSGHGGPGYAAPVVRKVATENSEPKSFKPRHPPKPVVKKTKKPKESEKEDSVERSGNQDSYKSDNESTATKEDMNVDDAVSESKNDDASYRPTTNAHVLNMSEDGGETPSKGSNPGGSWLSREPLATMQNGVHAQTKENQTKATDVGTAKDEGDPQEETPALSTHKATEGNRAKTQLGGKTIVWNTEEEIQKEDQNSAFDGTNGNNGENFKTQRSEELPDIDYYMVSYTGPVCKELQHGQGKVSERAEVMDAFDEHDEVEGIDEARTSCGKTRLSSLLHDKGGEQGQKKVKASAGDNRRRHRNLRHLATRRNSPFSRVHNSSVTLKESVLPVYNGREPTYSPSEISKNSMNVTPVTIFALARNRQENTSQKHGRSVNGSLGQKKGMTETSNLSKKEADKGMFELHNDDIMQVMDKTDWKRPAYHGTVDISRPPSVQKSESSLMRWCIKALKKVDLEVLFPPKPTRPKSSPSSVKSETAKRERGNLIQLNNSTTKRSRPKTADSILSTTSSTKEHSWFHYEGNPSTNETVKQQPRDFKSAASLAQSSKWEQVTSDNDEDFLDGYRAMQSGIVFQEPEEDDVKDMSRESAGFESDIPVIGTSDCYGGIWQIKVLDRASRLQQLRQERQKTAKERRQALESKRREKWKNSSHLECAQVSKSEWVIEFITPPPTTSSRETTPLPSSDLIQNCLVKEREFASERPYRLRLSSESIGQRLNPVARNLINLKTSDHHVSDVVNVLPKPPPSASIPSKCSRYVLVAQPDDKQPQIQATMMEETLLMVRFPRTRIRRKRHNSATSPKVLSNRKVTIES